MKSQVKKIAVGCIGLVCLGSTALANAAAFLAQSKATVGNYALSVTCQTDINHYKVSFWASTGEVLSDATKDVYTQLQWYGTPVNTAGVITGTEIKLGSANNYDVYYSQANMIPRSANSLYNWRIVGTHFTAPAGTSITNAVSFAKTEVKCSYLQVRS